MSESRFYHFSDRGLFYGVESLAGAVTSLREGGFVWLNYYKPEKEDLNILIDLIGIHPLSVEVCFDDKQIPKIEHFLNNTFILFNAFSYKDQTLYTDEVNFFIGRNFLITVSGHNSGDRRPLKNIEEIIANDQSVVRTGPAVLMHKILDMLVDQKYDAFDTMEDELEEAEDMIIDNVDNSSADCFTCGEPCPSRRALSRAEILVKITADCPIYPEKCGSIQRYLRHLNKFFELTETYREMETSLMELYTSLLNNNMTRMSNETNASVKRLTMITTVFMPLTLIASIGGMSEWTMITGGEPNWKSAYSFLLAGMVIIGGLNYFFIKGLEKGIFKRKKKKPEED